MKDYKLECEKLRAEIKSLNRELDYLRREIERRSDRDAEFKTSFRKFLMETLSD